MKNSPHVWKNYASLLDVPFPGILDAYDDIVGSDLTQMRAAALWDRYYLFVHIFGRLDMLHPWIYARVREVERDPDGYLDLWAREHYKMLRVDEPVWTPEGWKPHGYLEPGDEVFSPDGKRVKVLARTKIFTDGPAFEITFDDGVKIRAGADHLWDVEVKTRKRIRGAYKSAGPKRIGRETKTLSTREISQHSHAQDKRYAVRACEPVSNPKAALPIEPYVLGCWLGDGTSANGDVTCGDPELFSEMTKRGAMLGHNKSPKRNAAVRKIDGLYQKLKTLDLIKNKHIPRKYFDASVDQRMGLLRGLMDTDGHCSVRGTATFVNINYRLMEDTYELCVGLGLKPVKHRYVGKHNGEDYPFWQVSFQAYEDACPFTIPRKVSRCKAGSRKHSLRFIVSCEPIAPEPMSCIQVEGGKYLAGRELVPTRNSSVITYGGVIQEVLRDPELTVGIFSHTKSVAKGFLRQIQIEFDNNAKLQTLFPDILYRDPAKQAQMWSLDAGLVLKRKTNPKEPTISAHGLVDGMPTGAHFGLMVYDDVVTRESVATPEQVAKTTEMWELSDNLGTVGGRKWHVGTRYSYADTYEAIMKRGSVKVRMHPATSDGTITGKPVLFPQEVWERKVRDQGEATISCHCAGTSVLMEDWTYQAIEDIKVGDVVVGFSLGTGKGAAVQLTRTRVVSVNKRRATAYEYTTDKGNKVRCTPDHKWWAKRSGTDGHSPYAPLGTLRKQDLKSIYRVSNFHGWVDYGVDPAWHYLAGIMDGEGSFSGNRITITQSKQHNPEVHEKIAQTLRRLKISYSRSERPAHGRHKGSTQFIVNGGRHERHRVLLNAPLAKRGKIIDSLYCTMGGKSSTEKERVVEYRDLGEQWVYNIQTETGNYVANGFASKNCQMLQNPLAGQQRMFNVEDLQVYEVRPATLAVYIMCDPARSKKTDSDNTAIVVLGVDAGNNKYLLDGWNHKMDLMERWKRVANLYVKWKNQTPGIQAVYVGYESFGAQADLDYFNEQMKVTGVRFDIIECAWPREGPGSKIDRVQRLGPDFRSGKFFLPYPTDEKKLTANQLKMVPGYSYRVAKPIIRFDGENNKYDMVDQFRMQVHFFPFGGKKDLVDAASRIYDMEPRRPAYNEPSYAEPDYV